AEERLDGESHRATVGAHVVVGLTKRAGRQDAGRDTETVERRLRLLNEIVAVREAAVFKLLVMVVVRRAVRRHTSQAGGGRVKNVAIKDLIKSLAVVNQ